MRVRAGDSNQEFAKWLRQMSFLPQSQGSISLPTFISICTTVEELCAHVFPPRLMGTAHQNTSTFIQRTILAMRNDTVATINQKVL